MWLFARSNLTGRMRVATEQSQGGLGMQPASHPLSTWRLKADSQIPDSTAASYLDAGESPPTSCLQKSWTGPGKIVSHNCL